MGGNQTITIEKLKILAAQKNQPVIIFGAGLIGEIVHKALKTEGIAIAAFCDNSSEKQGSFFHEVPVEAIDSLSLKYKNALFLVAVSRYKDVFVQLNDFGFSEIYNSIKIVEGAESEYVNLPDKMIEESIKAYKRHLIDVSLRDEIILPNIGLVTTQKCSLRCKHCSNLMQYYKKPIDYSYDVNIRSVGRLLTFVKKVERVSVIGGEPFMNKDVSNIIDWLSCQDKIDNVTIFTNGTIIPNEEILLSMKNEKVFVSISDYGSLSSQKEKLAKKLNDYGINYTIAKSSYWVNLGNLERRSYDKEAADLLFNKCWHEGHTELIGGQLHYCSRSSGGEFLGIYKSDENDYIDLLDETMTDEKLEVKFRQFIQNTNKAPTACYYCSGRTWKSDIVPVAVQVKQPLEINE